MSSERNPYLNAHCPRGGGTKVIPTRKLIGDKPCRYTPACNTDVSRTWRKARLLARIRSNKAAE